MIPLKTRVDLSAVEQPQPLRSRDQTGRLNRLRLSAMRCRARARVDVSEACNLLCVDEAQSELRFEEALLRSLHQGLGRKPRFYAVGAAEESFDERWLLQVLDAAERGDMTSVEFLVRSRIDKTMQRSIRFLIRGAVGRFGGRFTL
ncbi:hypothetical protein [Neptunicoccus cionae]|uniref:hypothetical protein n=1 Tax=Neptunicoccus cionae TaxID=2035344 RepID=UPI000C791D1B|nr:hypothetical protein [Amylibacter cionae]PLS22609.1 hypothetical protein C0U40_00165 [Amylibacter cionae]